MEGNNEEKSANHVYDTEVISFDIAIRNRYELDLKDKFHVVLREGKYYVERIKPQYPKTYEDCCKVLGLNSEITDSELIFYHPFHRGDYNGNYTVIRLPEMEMFEKFIQLYLCKNAYWKIAGDWKPEFRFGKKKYCIMTKDNKVISATVEETNRILTFPTEEMRDAFLENFKELIEECKELL